VPASWQQLFSLLSGYYVKKIELPISFYLLLLVYDSRQQYIRVVTWLCDEHCWVSDRGSSSDHGSFQKFSV
jgi:hypothetical protein